MDFIFVNDRLKNKVVGTGVQRGVTVGTDHFFVVCRIKALCQRSRHHAKITPMEQLFFNFSIVFAPATNAERIARRIRASQFISAAALLPSTAADAAADGCVLKAERRAKTAAAKH
ncbi:hypothetical protein EVAR_53176_1 [Eumeta japonica]|uniref:Uncharacterized protein n=1 Tax=Eumeta variegata TaxID=151549 RepID=A0A4C1YUS3_EUMVA|nr:hypothetical protein EVAR_53176_1 [Eumeta japonica]